MKKVALLIAVIATIAVLARISSPIAMAQDAAEPEASKALSILIIDGQNNHKWAETTPILVDALEGSGRFAVEVSTSPKKGSPAEAWDSWRPAFANYDVVLSNYNGEMWPDEVRASFLSYVQGGGGLVIVHAANNSFGMWPEYNEAIGLGGWGGRNEKHGPYVYLNELGEIVRDEKPGKGGNHGAKHEFVVEVYDSEHPITKGMPMRWKHAKDELYDMLRGPAKNMTILATAMSPVTKRQEPMIFTIDYGKGRVFHTPMGHDTTSMSCHGFYNTIQRGAEWAATGAVTLPLDPSFPNESSVSPVQ